MAGVAGFLEGAINMEAFKPLKDLVSQVYIKALDARSNRTHCLTLARWVVGT